jgi:predicted NBD/HSP70 family sugar kinase
MNDQAGDIQAARIRIASTDEIAAALDSAGLRLDWAVIVLVGGAGIMGEKEFETPVSRRVHDGGCRRSAKEIRTEWIPVSRNGAAPGSGAASAGRVRWPCG